MASRGWTVAVAASVLLVLSTLAACQAEQRVPAPTVSSITDAQVEQLYQDHADSLRRGFEIRHPGVVVPDVARIRFVEPQEFAQAMLDCLGAAGFTASALPDGGLSYAEVPPSQAEALDLANYVCTLQYPVNPRYDVPLNDDQLAYLYDYYVLDLVPCLEQAGHPVSDPPTRQSFVETYGSKDTWTPYSDVAPGTDEEWYALNKKCPQVPEGLYG